jgi:hypothetical protein
MEVSGQLYAPAALSPGKEFPYSFSIITVDDLNRSGSI